MKFKYYNPVDEKGGCIFRSFSKFFNKDYNDIKKEIKELQEKIGEEDKYELYLNQNNVYDIKTEYRGKIKDYKNKGKSIIYCYDKKDFYHMVAIIDDVLYDKNEDSLDLYVLQIFKEA